LGAGLFHGRQFAAPHYYLSLPGIILLLELKNYKFFVFRIEIFFIDILIIYFFIYFFIYLLFFINKKLRRER